jgi:hypothetical protein
VIKLDASNIKWKVKIKCAGNIENEFRCEEFHITDEYFELTGKMKSDMKNVPCSSKSALSL